MATSTDVTLTPEQLAYAYAFSDSLHAKARQAGRRDAHGAKPGDITPARERAAAAAEYAVALYFGVPWTAANPGALLKGPDIGTRTQVRSIDNLSKGLLIREWDIRKYGNVPFVLVYTETGRYCRLLGWRRSGHASIPGKLTKLGRNDRPEVFRIDQQNLHPLEWLKNP